MRRIWHQKEAIKASVIIVAICGVVAFIMVSLNMPVIVAGILSIAWGGFIGQFIFDYFDIVHCEHDDKTSPPNSL